jgi:hypothetical protein
MPSEPANETKKPQIHVDEEWKERVKAEDKARDQQSQAEPPQQKATRPEAPPKQPQSEPAAEPQARQLPAADFATIVSLFSTQALVALGVLPNPATGKPDAELMLARHLIDLLDVLQEKTKGNLAGWEHTALDTTLHELRMLYVEKTRSA